MKMKMRLSRGGAGDIGDATKPRRSGFFFCDFPPGAASHGDVAVYEARERLISTQKKRLRSDKADHRANCGGRTRDKRREVVKASHSWWGHLLRPRTRVRSLPEARRRRMGTQASTAGQLLKLASRSGRNVQRRSRRNGKARRRTSTAIGKARSASCGCIAASQVLVVQGLR